MHSRAYDLDSICSAMHNVAMIWEVQFDPAFNPEFDALAAEVKDELLAQAKLLEAFGPKLGRPRVDTLKGSRHANMKETRFEAGDGGWRIDFAFDLKRQAILLAAGRKLGVRDRKGVVSGKSGEVGVVCGGRG